MRRRGTALGILGLVILSALHSDGRAETTRWGSKTPQRATGAAYIDSAVATAASLKFAMDNDLVGFEVTDLGPVPGGKEFEVRMVFDAVGTVPDLGDITAVVFVATDLSDAYVVNYENPDSTSGSPSSGDQVNNYVEYRAEAEAFGDATVRTYLDSRFDAGVKFTNVEAVTISSDSSGTTVDVRMDSDSNQAGKGDVIARVLVTASSETVINVTGY